MITYIAKTNVSFAGYWGRGETIEIAKKKFREAGGRGRSAIYRVEHPDDSGKPSVNDAGYISAPKGSKVFQIKGKKEIPCTAS